MISMLIDTTLLLVTVALFLSGLIFVVGGILTLCCLLGALFALRSFAYLIRCRRWEQRQCRLRG